MRNKFFSTFITYLKRFIATSPSKRLIARMAWRHWHLICLGILSAVVAALSEGITLAIIFLVVEVLTADAPVLPQWLPSFPTPLLAGFLMAAAVIAQASQSLMRYGNKLCVSYFAARCSSIITSIIHRQILTFSFPFASNYKVGELVTSTGAGVGAVVNHVESTSDLAVNLLMSAVYLTVLLRISPWLLLVAILLAVVVAGLQQAMEPSVRAGSQRKMLITSDIRSRLTEDYQALRLIHTNGEFELAAERLDALMRKMEAALRIQARRLALIEPVSTFLPILAVSIILVLSLLLVGSDTGLVLPGLVTFVLALQRLNSRIGGVASSWNSLADNSGRLALTDKILDNSGKQFRRMGGISYTGFNTAISFRHVSLRYKHGQSFALTDVSLELRRGRTVALVGPSGAGKSSIVDLLVGLYEPSDGEIFVDGVPISRFNLSSFQKNLGVVSQDVFLFNASIAENLSYGMGKVSLQELERAANLAQASTFIESLPDGYNTLLGERGYRLSGGQRQRLSLARAFLRRPDLLVLDEATSALDTGSERLVQDALQRFQEHTAVLVVAHRLSTIIGSDEIIVLDQGQIVERGSHSELLTCDGLYKKLWAQQSQAAAT